MFLVHNIYLCSVIKNQSAMQQLSQTRVSFLGQEDSLQENIEPTSVLLPGESPWAEETGGLTVHGVAKSWKQLSN